MANKASTDLSFRSGLPMEATLGEDGRWLTPADRYELWRQAFITNFVNTATGVTMLVLMVLTNLFVVPPLYRFCFGLAGRFLHWVGWYA